MMTSGVNRKCVTACCSAMIQITDVTHEEMIEVRRAVKRGEVTDRVHHREPALLTGFQTSTANELDYILFLKFI